MRKAVVAEIFARFQAANPEPRGELQFSTPFQLLVAVILSAQATDTSVNKATAPLFASAPTPEAMLALGEEGLIRFIRTIGLYRNKAHNIIATCHLLLARHQGLVPQTRAELEALPGVGRKTANVVLNIAFGLPTLAVDTHVFRVSNRLGISRGKTPEAVETGLLKAIPDRYQLHAHHWLILHGRYICKARKPQCDNCRLFDLCEFKGKSA